MAGNQREMERRERRAQKDKKHKRIIWIIIAVIILVLVVMKVCEININSVKNHFVDEDGNFTLTDGVGDDNFPYSIDSSRNVKLVNINNELGILTPSSFTVLNGTDGEVQYTFEHGYSNPILESSGIYSLVYDQGGNNFRLDTTSDSVYEEDTSNLILCADVAKNGSVAIATTSNEKLCDIVVYSKSLVKLMEISISNGYVVSIDISDNGKNVAVAVVTGENANLKTTVYTYNISSSADSEKAVELPQGSIIDLKYSGSNILVTGDSYAGVIKNSEKYQEIYAKDDISTCSIAYTPSGDLILVYNSYSNSTDNVIARINKNGKIKKEINVSGSIKSVTAGSSLVSVLTNSEILTYNLSDGSKKSSLSTDDSAKSICCLGSEIYIHKQSLIDKSEAENN
jgi:hypothetical protein